MGVGIEAGLVVKAAGKVEQVASSILALGKKFSGPWKMVGMVFRAFTFGWRYGVMIRRAHNNKWMPCAI